MQPSSSRNAGVAVTRLARVDGGESCPQDVEGVEVLRMTGLMIGICCGAELIAMGFLSRLGWGWIAFGAALLLVAVVGTSA
jgi:hypothetical protein